MSGELWKSRHTCVFTAVSETMLRCGGCGATKRIEDCCTGKQRSYPRPNITERHDDASVRELSTAYAGSFDCDVSLNMVEPRNDPVQIEARFRKMRDEYEATRPGLVNWKRDNPNK